MLMCNSKFSEIVRHNPQYLFKKHPPLKAKNECLDPEVCMF